MKMSQQSNKETIYVRICPRNYCVCTDVLMCHCRFCSADTSYVYSFSHLEILEAACSVHQVVTKSSWSLRMGRSAVSLCVDIVWETNPKNNNLMRRAGLSTSKQGCWAQPHIWRMSVLFFATVPKPKPPQCSGIENWASKTSQWWNQHPRALPVQIRFRLKQSKL